MILTSSTRHRLRRCQSALLGFLAIALAVVAPVSPLVAQRIAPSGVQRLEVAPNGLTRADSIERRNRSHIHGAVHGGIVGFGAGAITSAALFGLSYAAPDDRKRYETSGEQLAAFWIVTSAGAVAGTAIGALVGGIIGR